MGGTGSGSLPDELPAAAPVSAVPPEDTRPPEAPSALRLASAV
ncbi:hypothetical protein [Streptomyces sp. NPDC002276]